MDVSFLDAVTSLVLTCVSKSIKGRLTHQNPRLLIGCHMHAHATSNRHFELFTRAAISELLYELSNQKCWLLFFLESRSKIFIYNYNDLFISCIILDFVLTLMISRLGCKNRLSKAVKKKKISKAQYNIMSVDIVKPKSSLLKSM